MDDTGTMIMDTDDEQQKNHDQASQNEQQIQWVVWLDSYLLDYFHEMADDMIIITRKIPQLWGIFYWYPYSVHIVKKISFTLREYFSYYMSYLL